MVHTVEVENQTNALLLEIRRAESAARGYLLTKGPEFLADHDAAVAAIMPELDKLARLTRDNPVQVENIKKLRAAIEIAARPVRATRWTSSSKASRPRRPRWCARPQPTTRHAAIRDVGEAMRGEEAATVGAANRQLPIAARRSPPP